MAAEDAPPGDFTFPKSRRLLTKKQFDAVFQEGRKKVRPSLVVYFLPSEASRLGLVTSRKVGNAVVRNRVRRRLREIFRLHPNEFPPNHDVVALARSKAAEVEYEQLREDFLSACRSFRRDSA